MLEAIWRIFKASRWTYAAPRIHAELRSKGTLVSRKTVHKLMKQNGISPPRRKKRSRGSVLNSVYLNWPMRVSDLVTH